jgi:hypothetical protein
MGTYAIFDGHLGFLIHRKKNEHFVRDHSIIHHVQFSSTKFLIPEKKKCFPIGLCHAAILDFQLTQKNNINLV